MKLSKLYRKAAEMVDSGHSRYACHAIYELKRKKPVSMAFHYENDPEALALSYMFKNSTFNNTLNKGVFGKPEVPANRQMRVTALLLMSAMMECQGM